MKKFLAVLLLLFFILSIGVTVYATTGDFCFDLYADETDQTAYEEKDDDEQKLYIRLNKVTLGGCCENHEYVFWFRGRSYLTNRVVTNAGDWSLWDDNWAGELRNLPYTTYQSAGMPIFLSGQTDEESPRLIMEGRWTP